MEAAIRKALSVLIGAFEPEVNLAFVDNVNPDKTQGNVWIKTNRGLEMRRMVIDKPRHLKRHDDGVTRMLFNQVERLGFELHHMEIKTPTERRIYRAGNLTPVAVQPTTPQQV